MIETNLIYCPHIPKTGGDSRKFIFKTLNLPEHKIHYGPTNKHKVRHRPDKCLILPIRKLPEQIISSYFESNKHKKITITTLEWAFKNQKSESHMSQHTINGTLKPKHFIRSENMLDDFHFVLSQYYKLTKEQTHIIYNTKTKQKLTYERGVLKYFTIDQIAQLYEMCPIWKKYEIEAYGVDPLARFSLL